MGIAAACVQPGHLYGILRRVRAPLEGGRVARAVGTPEFDHTCIQAHTNKVFARRSPAAARDATAGFLYAPAVRCTRRFRQAHAFHQPCVVTREGPASFGKHSSEQGADVAVSKKGDTFTFTIYVHTLCVGALFVEVLKLNFVPIRRLLLCRKRRTTRAR
jgi:hypothetical protein